MSRCYLCLHETKFPDALLCTNCFCHLQNYQWTSCARCGDFSCAGCQQLSDFTKITSAYAYQDALAHILTLAKADNNLNVQKLFSELFFIPIKNSLRTMLLEEKYDFIMLAPLRKERVFHGSWHPNVFYEEVLSYLYTHELQAEVKAEILYPHFSTKKKKQAFVPSSTREIQKNTDLSLILTIPRENCHSRESGNPGKILLLDDVLTSGKTSLLCQSLCQTQLGGCRWDLFTIFRTPR
jgi:predicted amidophosphoribosyltransferase